MMTVGPADPRRNFAPRRLPWLIALTALIVFGLTLNRWVSLSNLLCVAKNSGWTWWPETTEPLFYLLTRPFRLFPESSLPLALNVLSAVCAALTLAMLARSVALLPHDRTESQRVREPSEFSFLTLSIAWIPPLFAAAVCGLQLTFWEQATNGTGEMFELFLFAFVIWSLLEYRIDDREGRLYLVALVYGAAMADNWAMIGYFPLFIGALIWIRGLTFFNSRFLSRMTLFGVLGLLCYFLLPLIAMFSHKIPLTFWQALKLNLSQQYGMLRTFVALSEPRSNMELMLLPSVLPILLLAIRWSSSFGDRSHLGIALAHFMFHVIYAVFLLVGVWIAFDPPFSARHLGYGIPCLTFYYLGALGIGYFSGYFILIFGRMPRPRSRQQKTPPIGLPQRLCLIVIGLFCATVVAGLAYKNLPQIRSSNDSTLDRYASLAIKSLPADGSVLISDDRERLFLVMAALARDHREDRFVPIDTQSMPSPQYQDYLHSRYPKAWPSLNITNKLGSITPYGLNSLLGLVSKSNALFYLHPSYGYYFEQFYQEPHGLVYRLRTLPKETWLPPAFDSQVLAENEEFWSNAEANVFPSVEHEAVPGLKAEFPAIDQLLTRFHTVREPNPNATVAGLFYSRAVNTWGVAVQRAGQLDRAATHFAAAKELNPDNVVAQINLEFNKKLHAGQTANIDLSKTTSDQFGKYHDWNDVLSANGTFDEPSFCFENGVIMASGNGFIHQALASFLRVRELASLNLPCRIWIAELYVLCQLPDRSLEAISEVRAQPGEFGINETNQLELSVIEAAAYIQKKETARGRQLLESQLDRYPTNERLSLAAARFYVSQNLFPEALKVIDRNLEVNPTSPGWLFYRGYVCIQLKRYDDDISALSGVLTIQTNNVNARFNRAVASLDAGKLDAAKSDYQLLLKDNPKAYPLAYGLAEIAWRTHQTNDAIKYYGLYLSIANTNTDESKMVRTRLLDLQGKPH